MSGMQGNSAPFGHLSNGDQHHTSHKKRSHNMEDSIRAAIRKTAPVTAPMATAEWRGRRPSRGAAVDEELLREEAEELKRKEEGRRARAEAAERREAGRNGGGMEKD